MFSLESSEVPLVQNSDSCRALLSGAGSEHADNEVSRTEAAQEEGWLLELLSVAYHAPAGVSVLLAFLRALLTRNILMQVSVALDLVISAYFPVSTPLLRSPHGGHLIPQIKKDFSLKSFMSRRAGNKLSSFAAVGSAQLFCRGCL